MPRYDDYYKMLLEDERSQNKERRFPLPDEQLEKRAFSRYKQKFGYQRGGRVGAFYNGAIHICNAIFNHTFYGEGYITYQQLSEESGISVRQLTKYVKFLKQLGRVKVERVWSEEQHKNLYRLVSTWDEDDPWTTDHEELACRQSDVEPSSSPNYTRGMPNHLLRKDDEFSSNQARPSEPENAGSNGDNYEEITDDGIPKGKVSSEGSRNEGAGSLQKDPPGNEDHLRSGWSNVRSGWPAGFG